MKKRLLPMSILLVSLLLGLCACGNGNGAAAGGQDSSAPQETVTDSQEPENVEKEEETTENVVTDQAVQGSTEQESAVADNEAAAAGTEAAAVETAADADTAAAEDSSAPGSNALAVYFSRVGNTDFPADVDADSSASIRVDENGLMGNAGQIAAWIAEEAGCETMEILTEDAYPVNYDETVNQAKQEQNEGFRPMLKADEKAVEDYDTIYLVFPNWWGDLPMPVFSFLDSHDLSGKTVNVFVTHEGSGFSGTVGTIRELEPDAEVLEGLAVQGASVTDEEQNIRQWVIDHQN
jgi:flavodoxin